jgi:formylglycine-generating enzyme required for sulfatase activity
MKHNDITNQAIEVGQYPERLQALGFCVWQAIDEQGAEVAQYFEPPLCEVPAGPFLMGSDKERDAEALKEELPQHSVTLAAFQIGTYPVTVTEYAYAVRAGAVEEPPSGLTIEDGISKPSSDLYLGWQLQLRWPDRSVVQVDWFNAMKYAAWLSRLSGKAWGLPTEAQWEKAARGTDGRIYPWGSEWDDAFANVLGNPPLVARPIAPVGEYPAQSASPYGVFDVAGNVWEWTISTLADYPYDANDGREHHRADEVIVPQYDSAFDEDIGLYVNSVINGAEAMVVRGGSWNNILECARAAYRYTMLPDWVSTYGGTGIRLVLS